MNETLHPFMTLGLVIIGAVSLLTVFDPKDKKYKYWLEEKFEAPLVVFAIIGLILFVLSMYFFLSLKMNTALLCSYVAMYLLNLCWFISQKYGERITREEYNKRFDKFKVGLDEEYKKRREQREERKRERKEEEG